MGPGKKGFIRDVRGEAVAILMAAMMIGGFLFWLTAGHLRGMHGGNREGLESRPAVAVAPVQKDSQTGAGREGSPPMPSEESFEKDRGVNNSRSDE
ncbi:MAG TPA: hypothetical protein DD658_07230 [Deltaproteobacteria bacterium]|nr:MAG: hypothetical protein A2X88_01300 [Deltaproteobacteria bacterium GWC2_65_14]HBO69920.1 hypothetical protein [Deltaproteobacteria bacterium]